MKFAQHVVYGCLLIGLGLPRSLAGDKQGDVYAALVAKDAARTVKVVQLNHADVSWVIGAINTLRLPVQAVRIGDSNKLLLSGSEADVQKVIDQVIAQIDVPATTVESSVSTEVIPLGSLSPTSLMPVLKTIASEESTHLAIDPWNRLLVVRGRQDEIALFQAFIDQINRPTRALNLQFFFIRAKIGSKFDETENDLPPVLTPIAKSLANNGFGKLSVLAPLTVVSAENQKFTLNSSALDAHNNGTNLLMFHVGGEAQLQPDEIVQLSLQAGIVDANDKTLFQVNTTITTKIGDYVILAASPSPTAHADAVALVVRVTVN